jgi:hypothetical protein
MFFTCTVVNIQGTENGFLQLTNKHDTLFIAYQRSAGESEDPKTLKVILSDCLLWEEYCSTIYTLTHSTNKSHTSSVLENEEATICTYYSVTNKTINTDNCLECS